MRLHTKTFTHRMRTETFTQENPTWTSSCRSVPTELEVNFPTIWFLCATRIFWYLWITCTPLKTEHWSDWYYMMGSFSWMVLYPLTIMFDMVFNHSCALVSFFWVVPCGRIALNFDLVFRFPLDLNIFSDRCGHLLVCVYLFVFSSFSFRVRRVIAECTPTRKNEY